MPETASIDDPPIGNRSEGDQSATVSASALALHLDCSRAYIGKLEAEGVIQRQGDGFPLDQSRVAYLRYLRRGRCAPRGDLATRRNIERAVFEIRTEIAKVCEEMADKAGEPPLEEQG